MYCMCVYIDIYWSTGIINKCDGWTQDLTYARQELYL